MLRMRRGVLFGLFLLLAGRVSLWAQAATPSAPSPAATGRAASDDSTQSSREQTTTLQVTSRLVVLDVVVTDRQGKPVTDLVKEDFKVTEEQELQRIKNFEAPGEHALPPGNVVQSSADLGKIGDAALNILVLDELNTRFEDNAFSRYSLQRFLKSQAEVMAPTILLAANDKSFMVLQDYTQNRDVLEAALKRDPVQYPWRMSRNGGSGPDAIVRLAQSLETLQSIAQASAGSSGRKIIIWVGKGFPSVDLTGLDDDSATRLRDVVKRCTDIMLSSRVTLYIVDPTPLSSAQYDAETPTDLAALEEETGDEPFSNAVRFSTMAPATGGRVFALRNDVDREIASSIRDGSRYYTLSYTPTGLSSEPGDYRHIRITMNRPGLTATTRDGYYTPSVARMEANQQDSTSLAPVTGDEVVDVANAALSKMAYNGVKVRAARGATDRFSIAVADSSLSWQAAPDGSSTASVTVITICFSAKGKVLLHTTQEKTLQAASPNSRPGAEEVFTTPMTLPTGTTRVRFVVRNPVTGYLGTAEISVR